MSGDSTPSGSIPPLADQIDIGLVQLDSQGQVALWNRWMAVHSGFAAADILGRSFRDIYPAIAGQRLGLAIESAIRHRLSSVVSSGLNTVNLALYETPTNRFENRPMQVNVMVSARRDEAGGNGCLLQVFDVTASVRREALLRERLSDLRQARAALDHQARELEVVNQELAQFAYIASHDMRQPLRTIIGLLRLIEKEIGTALTPDAREMFDLVTGGAKRMDAMIVGLLEYSRADSRLEGGRVPLAPLVKDALLNLDHAIAQAEARVVVIGDETQEVLGDPHALGRVLLNLLDNAIKYRSLDRVPEIEIGWRSETDGCLVWVKDNGRGINPADHDRAFQIFQRLSPQGEMAEGFGIGLSVVKKIVERLGGRIWVDSAPGQGCAFFVVLPQPAPR